MVSKITSFCLQNVTRQECADHNFTKDKAVEGTIVFQQEKGKCCSFNEVFICKTSSFLSLLCDAFFSREFMKHIN